MAYVVTSPCIGTHDTACMKVCPVNCFYDVPLADLGLPPLPADAAGPAKMLIINPDECINCTRCEPECPVAAIFAEDEVPDSEKQFIETNRKWFEGRDQAQIDAARIEP